MTSLPVSDNRISELQNCTKEDPDLQQLITIILIGWPDQRNQCPKSVLPYWNYSDELTVVDGLVFKGERIVIPSALRGEMLKRIHMGHMGIVKCKSRAKEVMLWPNMHGQIEDMVSTCLTCSEFHRCNPKEHIISHEIPERLWQTVAADLFQIEDVHYLIVVDYHSRYFELERMPSTTSSAVINKMKAIFARFGIPEKLVSDNGPQPYSERLTELNWSSLELRRKYLCLLQLYKIIHGYSDIDYTAYVDLTGPTRTTSNHDFKIRPKAARTNYWKFSFFNHYINDWNSLPN